MREIVTVCVGQCGNQVGRCFFDLALKEHASAGGGENFDAAMSSYFRNVDPESKRDVEGIGGSVKSLKARAVLVDTEEGVLRQTLASPLGQLFDATEFVRGVSGAGNNFANGYYSYGEEYGESIVNSVRKTVERCDSLQAFFLLHSTGGGTGSGLGTRTLSLLKDSFPEALRFASPILPSADDDVVTSPYNAAFAVEQLREYADCVFPMDNQALLDICETVRSKRAIKPAVTSVAERMEDPRRQVNLPGTAERKAPSVAKRVRETSRRLARGGSSSLGGTSTANSSTTRRSCTCVGSCICTYSRPPFDDMNSIAAHMLANLTCCARFHGKMNVDLSELTTNLVPFPHMQFVLSSLSPLFTLAEMPRNPAAEKRLIDQTFAGVLSRSHQLLKSDPSNGQYLACAFLLRGAVNLTDANRNVDKLSKQMELVSWNQNGFKLGVCNVPPVGQPHSLLCLSNNSCVQTHFGEMERRFVQLYGPRRKAFVHHYEEYGMESTHFESALETLRTLQEDYKLRANLQVGSADRIKIL